MMTRKAVFTIFTAIFFIAVVVICSIDTVNADDITTTTNTTATTTTTGDTTTTTTAGDTTTGAAGVTNIGGTTTYDASTTTETTNNIETTTNNTEIIQRGYSVSPIVNLSGYGSTVSTQSQNSIGEEIKKTTRLLIDISQMLEDFEARISRIEKALNIRPLRSSTSRSSSTGPEKNAREYSID